MMVQHFAYFLTLFLDFASFLLLLPVITEYILDFLLVVIESAFKLVNPDNTIRNIREITSSTQTVVVFLFNNNAFI